MQTHHPVSEETLADFLAGRLPEADRAGVEEHLGACPDCAGRAGEALLFQACLDPAGHEVPASPASARAMRAAAGIPVSVRRWSWASRAAAAGLLLAAGLFLRGRQERIPAPEALSPETSLPRSSGTMETGTQPRLFSPVPGTEILLGAHSLLSRRGADGPWELARGSCLAYAEGAVLHLAADDLDVAVLEGEVLMRRAAPAPVAGWLLQEARAGMSAPCEALVLAGRAEASLGNRRIPLAEGESLSIDKGGAMAREILPPAQRALRRASVSSSGASGIVDARGTGKVRRDASSLTLDGGGGQASWLIPGTAEPYQATLRVRLPERSATLGMGFRVGGRTSLWIPDEPGLSDGNWHTLQVTVSGTWVTMTLDGGVRHRAPEAGFKINPALGISGVGPAVWGGRVEVSEFSLVPLR